MKGLVTVLERLRSGFKNENERSEREPEGGSDAAAWITAADKHRRKRRGGRKKKEKKKKTMTYVVT